VAHHLELASDHRDRVNDADALQIVPWSVLWRWWTVA
jgi:hypothetical protein